MTRSGRSERIRSVSGSSSAPTRGSDLRLRRKVIVGADADDLRPGADREQHLGHGGHERDDASRTLGCGAALEVREPRHASPTGRAAQREERSRSENQLRLTSSHRKNGPPSIAVTTPTGTSTGASTRSGHEIAADEKCRAEERRCRQHEPMIHADHQSHEMRDDDADEADRPAERHSGARGSDALRNASRCVRPTSTPRADAAVRADAQQVQRPRQHGEYRERKRRRAAAQRRSARSCRRRGRPSASERVRIRLREIGHDTARTGSAPRRTNSA